MRHQPDARSLVSFFLSFRYSKSAKSLQISNKSAGSDTRTPE